MVGPKSLKKKGSGVAPICERLSWYVVGQERGELWPAASEDVRADNGARRECLVEHQHVPSGPSNGYMEQLAAPRMRRWIALPNKT